MSEICTAGLPTMKRLRTGWKRTCDDAYRLVDFGFILPLCISTLQGHAKQEVSQLIKAH